MTKTTLTAAQRTRNTAKAAKLLAEAAKLLACTYDDGFAESFLLTPAEQAERVRIGRAATAAEQALEAAANL